MAPPPEECLQLISRATQVFRERYILKQDQAKEEIQRRQDDLCSHNISSWQVDNIHMMAQTWHLITFLFLFSLEGSNYYATKKRNNQKISITVERKGKCQNQERKKKQQFSKTGTVSQPKCWTTLVGFTIKVDLKSLVIATRKSLREMAERLADKYEEAKEKQEDIMKRSVDCTTFNSLLRYHKSY